MQKLAIPALPFIPEKPQEKFPSKKERKAAIKDFVEKTKTDDDIQLQEPEVTVLEKNYDYHDYDGRKTLIYMEERIEEGRKFIQYARSPPVSTDPYRNQEIRKEVDEFMNSGIYVLSEEIIHYIENLLFFHKYNENVFGPHNYMINDVIVEIFGYQQIREKLKEVKGNDALTWFSRLLNVASRPLSVHEELIKQKIYQRSLADGGLVTSQERK